MSKTYFSAATFRFLRSLERHNTRDWFQTHKEEYERHVRAPYLELIADLQEPLAKISRHYRADTRKNGGSLFRIFRDTRFSNNKLPYKPWQGARFFHERRHEIQAPSFYMHIQPGDCFAGGGLWHPETETLSHIREFIADNPAGWKHATQNQEFLQHLQLGGESLIRPPRGYEANHALIEDLKRKDFIASGSFSDELACSDELLPHLLLTFKQVTPLVDYLCAAQELEF